MKFILLRMAIFPLFLAVTTGISACDGDSVHTVTHKRILPDPDNAGLILPAGFGALKFADGLGEARHLAVTPQGDVYVKLSSFYKGKGIYFLYDSNGAG